MQPERPKPRRAAQPRPGIGRKKEVEPRRGGGVRLPTARLPRGLAGDHP